MRKRVILSESDLHRIVENAVRRILKEEVTDLNDLYSRLDAELNGNYPGEAYVSRFYSQDNWICIAVDNSAYRREGRSIIDEIMNEYGYQYYDAGGADNYLMITYKKVA